MNNHQVSEALFVFLQAIYKFEQKEINEFSISWQEMLLLKHLIINKDMNMGLITNLLTIKPFQATRLVNGLIKKQLVIRFEKESDRRFKTIRITQEGNARMTKVDAFHNSVVGRASEKLGTERAEEILSMMFQLEELLGLKDN